MEERYGQVNEQHLKRLSRFKSFDYVDSWYEKAHERKTNSKKIQQINACFTQGLDYFDNAKDASLSVKPLLLYYGVLAICRGIILCNNKNKTEEQLKSSHGLEVYNWQQTLASGIRNVLDLEIKATDGTFRELVDVCSHLNSISFFLEATNNKAGNGHELGKPKFARDGSVFTLGDLLSRSIYTCHDYEDITGEPSQSYFSRVASTEEGMYFSFPFVGVPKFLSKKIDGESIVYGSSFRVAPGLRAQSNAKDAIVVLSNGDNSHYSKFPSFIYKGGDFATVISDFPNGDKLSEFTKLCLLSYILGMLVRYYPSKWISLLKNEKGDRAQPLILEIVSAIESNFYEEALKEMTGIIRNT
ncbi:YaaC family protein [Vibrio splendidus]